MRSVLIICVILFVYLFNSSCDSCKTQTSDQQQATSAPLVINPTSLVIDTSVLPSTAVWRDDTTCIGSGVGCSVSGLCGSNCLDYAVPVKFVTSPDTLIIAININLLRARDSAKAHFVQGPAAFSFDNEWQINSRIKSHMPVPKSFVNAGTLCPLHHSGPTYWFAVPASAMH